MTVAHDNARDTEIRAKLPLERQHLQALERMRLLDAYYRWTFRLLEPYLGRRVMDAGCGIGSFTHLLARKADYVLAVDLSPRNIEVVQQRFRRSCNVEVLQTDLEHDISHTRSKAIDTVVCLDVLEHVQDDVALMRKFREIVQPGGAMLVKVPACQWLYGTTDIASSHYRRYAKSDLLAKAARAGWESTLAFYMNIWGILPYWFKSRVLRDTRNFSSSFPLWQIRALARLVPLLQVFDRLIGPPVGQSAFLVAT